MTLEDMGGRESPGCCDKSREFVGWDNDELFGAEWVMLCHMKDAVGEGWGERPRYTRVECCPFCGARLPEVPPSPTASS